MENGDHNSVSHPRKCSHGVHWPAADPVNLGCQQCNPDGLGEGSTPVIARNTHVAGLTPYQYCIKCGNIRTYSTDNCRICGEEFPHDQVQARQQSFGAANYKRPGICPACFSTTHYETNKKGIWRCADCDTDYKAPKIKE